MVFDLCTDDAPGGAWRSSLVNRAGRLDSAVQSLDREDLEDPGGRHCGLPPRWVIHQLIYNPVVLGGVNDHFPQRICCDDYFHRH